MVLLVQLSLALTLLNTHAIGAPASKFLHMPFVDEMTADSKEAIREKCGGFYENNEYSWCKKALNPRTNLGLSYGVFRFDPWSLRMDEHGVKTHMFDCFSPESDFDFKKFGFSEDTHKPVYHEECLGKRTEMQTMGNGDIKPFKSYKDSIDLSNHGPLSIHAKFDIEGSEWAVFSTFTEEDYAKIVIFDVELHFCLPSVYRGGMTKEHFPATVKRQLALWNKHFYVTKRDGWQKYKNDMVAAGKEPSWSDAGCRWQDDKYEMMTLSYVNKAFVDAL